MAAKAVPSLRGLIRKKPSYQELAEAWKEVDIDATDRAAAILAASYVEDALRDKIITRLIASLSNSERDEIFDNKGPLSTFDSMIKAAYAFGLISIEARNDLHAIKQIRNCFAHAMIPLTFATPQVISKVETLSYLQHIGRMRGFVSFYPGVHEIKDPTRGKYVKTCSALFYEISFITADGRDLYREALVTALRAPPSSPEKSE
jgi:hypothetical protein